MKKNILTIPSDNETLRKFSKDEATILEACLSTPQFYGHVIRPAEIDLKSQDIRGKTSKKHYKGLTARIIQHEIDHLNGILFIDHVHTQKGKMFINKKDKKGKEQFIEVAAISDNLLTGEKYNEKKSQ